MAYYHCTVKIISRKDGRSSVAAAAYRSGEILYDEYTGITHDYSRKGGVVYSEIIVPPSSPPQFKNREILWNTSNALDHKSDAMLSREVENALPEEFSLRQQIEVVQDFIKTTFTSRNIIADFSIHHPVKKDDLGRPIDIYGNPTNNPDEYVYYNPHVHIMTTLRILDENGEFRKKSEIEYLCINTTSGEEKAFTSAELRNTKEGEWEKQYRYFGEDGNKVWLPKSQADIQGLERINRYPKTTKYGRSDAETAYINSTDFVHEIRKSWENICNKHLAMAGIPERIDCRSYAEQGIDKIPSRHKGPAVVNMEKRAERLAKEGSSEAKAVRSYISNLNAEIRKYNYVIGKIQNKIASESDKDLAVAKQLENLREQIVYSRFQLKRLRENMQKLDSEAENLKMRIENYEEQMSSKTKSLSVHQEKLLKLRADLKNTATLKIKTRKHLSEEISNEERIISNLDANIKEYQQRFGYDNLEKLNADKRTLSDAEAEITVLFEKINEISEKEKCLQREYMSLKSSIPKSNYNNVYRHRLSIRSSVKSSIPIGYGGLYSLIQKSFDTEDEEEKRRRR